MRVQQNRKSFLEMIRMQIYFIDLVSWHGGENASISDAFVLEIKVNCREFTKILAPHPF